MNKNFTPKLLGAVISGTGIRTPKTPRVVIGAKLNGFLQGDLMDANAIDEFIDEKIRQNDELQEGPIFEELHRLIDEEHQAMLTAVEVAVSDILGSAPEILNTLEEISAALGGDADFATTVLGKIGDNEDEIAELKARVDRIGMSVSGNELILTI